MVTLGLNGMEVQAEEGWTLLETARFYGIQIPTLCYHDGLSPQGACRLCLVELGEEGDSKLVSSCTYPAEEGLLVRTDSKRVLQARKLMVELLISICPSSKTIQDLASRLGVQKLRFKPRYEDCILCGLCVRMCQEQMDARAIGFINRGETLEIATPFDMKSEVCRQCGACMYVCPACELRCQGPEPPGDICGACLTLEPTCIESYPDLMCYMAGAGECGTCVREPPRETGGKK